MSTLTPRGVVKFRRLARRGYEGIGAAVVGVGMERWRENRDRMMNVMVGMVGG